MNREHNKMLTSHIYPIKRLYTFNKRNKNSEVEYLQFQITFVFGVLGFLDCIVGENVTELNSY